MFNMAFNGGPAAALTFISYSIDNLDNWINNSSLDVRSDQYKF
jgi:hypothetical protein